MKKDAASFKVKGLEATCDALAELTANVQNSIARKAANKAMDQVVTEAKQRAPVDTGHLAESIGKKNVKQHKRNVKGLVTISVGPVQETQFITPGTTNVNKPFKYGVPVEYGHVTKSGAFVPPASFMRSTYYNQRSAIPERFNGEMKQEIEAATKRAAKKSESKFKKEMKASEDRYTIAKAMRDRNL